MFMAKKFAIVMCTLSRIRKLRPIKRFVIGQFFKQPLASMAFLASIVIWL